MSIIQISISKNLYSVFLRLENNTPPPHLLFFSFFFKYLLKSFQIRKKDVLVKWSSQNLIPRIIIERKKKEADKAMRVLPTNSNYLK